MYWRDATSVASLERYPRGYAPKGKTPVLVLAQGQRERLNLISAVPHRGTLRFLRYRETLTAAVLIRFLERLVKAAGRKVFLVLDNLRVHHSRAVHAWLEQNRAKIAVFFLPADSPELHPDE